MPSLPGAFTPAEVLTAWGAGASAVKIFPASTGGPAHVRNLNGPLPDIPLVPSGGIGVQDAADYQAAGAFAVGLGQALTGDLDQALDRDALQRRCRALVASLTTRSPA